LSFISPLPPLGSNFEGNERRYDAAPARKLAAE
jgi:hypothetical protein